MPRGKKKAKKKVVKAKAKKKRRAIIPKSKFAARAKMLGVLCIKTNGMALEAVVVKRLTSEVKAAADAGTIIAITLKGGHVMQHGQVITAKEGRFDTFINNGLVAGGSLAEEDIPEGKVAEPHTNGFDHEAVPQAAAPAEAASA